MNFGRTLIVVAHPDDEILGCGGLIARLSSEGTEVGVLFMSDGETSRELTQSETKIAIDKRKEAARSSSERVGYSILRFGEFPDNRMDRVSLLEITKVIEGIINNFQPETVITHSAQDLNIDHKLTCLAVTTATRPTSESIVKNVLMFETRSSTEWAFGSSDRPFKPNFYVDISEHLETKISAIVCYQDELRPAPHPRSTEVLRAIAMVRGSEIGVAYAEAFEVSRIRL